MNTAMQQEVRRRRVFAGIAMIAGPVLIAVATLLGPTVSDDATVAVTELAANPDTVYVATLVYLGGLVLFLSVIFALAHLLREKEPWLSQIGAFLGMVGVILIATLSGIFTTVTQTAEFDIAAGVGVMDALESNPVVMVGFAGSLALGIGLVVFAVGLLRSRTAPKWTAWLLGLGAVLQLVGDLGAVGAISIAGIGVLIIALAPLGYRLITEPDEDWVHPPMFEGTRPVLGT